MSQPSREHFKQEGAMSQQLAAIDEDFIELAGSDPKTSLKIQYLKDLIQLGILDKDDPLINMMLVLLNGRRKALFATNDRSSDITKLGLQMPKARKVISAGDKSK